MSLSYNEYKGKTEMEEDIFKEIRTQFYESDYVDDDKLQVVMHRVIDNFVSYISINSLKTYLDYYDYSEQQTLDSGMLPERLEDPLKYDRCLLFCLIEQSLYNQKGLQKMEERAKEKKETAK